MEMERKRNAKEFAAFEAGWNAAHARMNHEWGPAPPQTSSTAYTVWKYTCKRGHIVRVKDCASCDDLKSKGVKGAYEGRYDSPPRRV